MLQNPRETGSKVRLQKQDLFAEQIQSLINDEHFYVTQLAIRWQEHINCIIKEDFSFQQIRFAEDVQQLAKEVNSENAIDSFVTDFSLASSTIREFLSSMNKLFIVEEAKMLTIA